MAFASVPHATRAAAVPASRTALAVVTTIFFMWGFLTCLNDILIPHLKAIFELNYTQAMLVQFTFFGAYFLMSLPAGRLVSHLGYKLGIVAGLCIAGVGALTFWPAAVLHSYVVFLAALFVLATGITVLQVAANPYIALLGAPETAHSRLTMAQALNSLGTTVAPLIGGALILAAAPKTAAELAAMPVTEVLAYRAHEAQSVQMPYLGLAIALFALAVLVWMFHLPAIASSMASSEPPQHPRRPESPPRAPGRGGPVFYVGAEVSIGSFMVNYLRLPTVGGLKEQAATHYVSMYWGGAMVGRLVGAALMVRLNPRLLLAAFAVTAALLLVPVMTASGTLAIYSIVAIGLFNSIMFPTLFPLGIERLGPLTSKASSLLIIAIVGGALLPLIQGALADRIGLQQAFFLPLLCYLYIAFWPERLEGCGRPRRTLSGPAAREPLRAARGLQAWRHSRAHPVGDR